MSRRHRLCLALLAGTWGCIDTNLTGPGRGDGGTIYFASNREGNNFEIYRIGGDGRGLTRLTEHPANDRAPVPSPDGSRIAWEREFTGDDGSVQRVEIWVMDADGRNARAVVSNGSFNKSPSWTAGDELVYASFVSGNWEIFITPAAGGDAVNLTQNEFADQYPRVSPAGNAIAFHTNRDLDFEIYAMNLDGSDPRNLTANGADDRFPAWSPDGGTIVWSRFIDSFDLYTMNADGSEPRAIATSPYLDMQAAVSPEGDRIVFQTDRVGSPRFALFVMPIDGGVAEPLGGTPTGGVWSDLDPYWFIPANPVAAAPVAAPH